MPRCDECQCFGHLRDDCVRRYPTVANGEVKDDDISHRRMDEDQAETNVSMTSQAPDERIEGPTPSDVAVNASPVEPPAEREALAPVAVDGTTLPVDPAVELPWDAPTDETVTGPGVIGNR